MMTFVLFTKAEDKGRKVMLRTHDILRVEESSYMVKGYAEDCIKLYTELWGPILVKANIVDTWEIITNNRYPMPFGEATYEHRSPSRELLEYAKQDVELMNRAMKQDKFYGGNGK